jgi:hypothetical protein
MKMVLLLVRLPAIIILGIVQVSVSTTCPWHCLCLLHELPITVNCSGLNLINFPTDVDTRVSTSRSSMCCSGSQEYTHGDFARNHLNEAQPFFRSRPINSQYPTKSESSLACSHGLNTSPYATYPCILFLHSTF